MKAGAWKYAILAGLFLVIFTALGIEGLALARLYRMEHPGAQTKADALFPDPSSAPLAGQDPFAELERMAQQMRDRMRSPMKGLWPAFGDLARLPEAGPRVALSEKTDRYVLRVEEPGLQQSQVRVDAKGREVTLRIERQASSAKDDDQRVERRASVQSFGLAHPVDSDHMKVEQQGDTMTVTLPKSRHG